MEQDEKLIKRQRTVLPGQSSHDRDSKPQEHIAFAVLSRTRLEVSSSECRCLGIAKGSQLVLNLAGRHQEAQVYAVLT